MNPIPESTINLIMSGVMGIFGGLITIPINAAIAWRLKRDEQLYQHKLDLIAKQRELLLQHKLEMERLAKNNELDEIKAAISQIEQRLKNG